MFTFADSRFQFVNIFIQALLSILHSAVLRDTVFKKLSADTSFCFKDSWSDKCDILTTNRMVGRKGKYVEITQKSRYDKLNLNILRKTSFCQEIIDTKGTLLKKLQCQINAPSNLAFVRIFRSESHMLKN